MENKIELIDKAVLIAEINRVLNSYDPNEITSGRYALVNLRDFINKLETTEVDLEKEINEYMKSHHLHIKDGGRIVFENDDTPNFICDFIDIAQHFYKLGLQKKGK